MSGIFAHSVVDILGRPVALADFAGRVTVVVNSASMCAFATRNMELLRTMQKHYSSTAPGRTQVLMFPSTDFAHQERLREEEIIAWAGREFGLDVYGINVRAGITAATAGGSGCPVFLFGRCHVKTMGMNWAAPPIFEACATACGPATWNWTKFVVSASGVPMARIQHKEASWPILKSEVDSVLKMDFGK